MCLLSFLFRSVLVLFSVLKFRNFEWILCVDVVLTFSFSFNKITAFPLSFPCISCNLFEILMRCFFLVIGFTVVSFEMRSGRISCPSSELAYNRRANFCHIR